MKKGCFITVEGIEGAGKSTAMSVIFERIQKAKIPVKKTREPGGTIIAEAIRKVLLSPHDEVMSAKTECLLMFASRAQHLEYLIKPALSEGVWVVCDRFTDASYAYQGGGRGLSLEAIASMERWVQDDLRPDLTILLDVPVALGLERMAARGKPDRIEVEQHEFFETVRQTYLEIAKKQPEQYRVIDAKQSLENVERSICDLIDNHIQRWR